MMFDSTNPDVPEINYTTKNYFTPNPEKRNCLGIYVLVLICLMALTFGVFFGAAYPQIVLIDNYIQGT